MDSVSAQRAVYNLANLTISVPDELKLQMDTQFPETNWSSVCRSAIQQYVFSRQGQYPHLEMYLDSVLQEITSEIGQPGIRTNIRVENRTALELVVDRINLVVSIVSGAVTIVGREAWHLAPLYLYPNRNSAANDFFSISPEDVIRTESLVKQSPVVRVKASAYVTGFQMPVQVQLQNKIPLDEWQTFITNVKAVWEKKAPGKS